MSLSCIDDDGIHHGSVVHRLDYLVNHGDHVDAVSSQQDIASESRDGRDVTEFGEILLRVWEGVEHTETEKVPNACY